MKIAREVHIPCILVGTQNKGTVGYFVPSPHPSSREWKTRTTFAHVDYFDIVNFIGGTVVGLGIAASK